MEEFLKSWKNIAYASAIIDDSMIRSIIRFAFDDSKPEHWRAAWLIDKACRKNPELLKPYLPEIYSGLKAIKNLSHIRHFLHIISQHPVPCEEQMPLYDLCLNLFSKSDSPIAVRTYAMDIAYSITKLHPELCAEMIQILEFILEQPCSAGVKAKGKNILKKLHLNIKSRH